MVILKLLNYFQIYTFILINTRLLWIYAPNLFHRHQSDRSKAALGDKDRELLGWIKIKFS